MIEIPITLKIIVRVEKESGPIAIPKQGYIQETKLEAVIDCSPGKEKKTHGIGKGPLKKDVSCQGCKRVYNFTCALRQGLCRKCGNWGKRPGAPGNPRQVEEPEQAPAKPMPKTLASLLEALIQKYSGGKVFCTGDAMALDDLTLAEANARLRRLHHLGAIKLKEEMHSHLTEWTLNE